MKEIQTLEKAIQPLRETLQKHPLYQSLNSLKDVGIFMELTRICCLGFYVFIKITTTTTYLCKSALDGSKKPYTFKIYQ